jgi:hypothetical protein
VTGKEEVAENLTESGRFGYCSGDIRYVGRFQ